MGAIGGLGQSIAADLMGAAGVAAQTIRPAALLPAMGSSVSNSSVVNNFQYTPTYAGAPRQPAQDFAIMQSMYGSRT